MNRFIRLFPKCTSQVALIGMVHLKSLPGTPNNCLRVEQIVDAARHDAEIYLKHHFDGICLENMHDLPYVTRRHAGPEITAVMTRACSEIKKLAGDLPCGVQVLAGLNKEALAVALAADLQFIRAEAFVFGHVADEGFMNACAGPLLRYRRMIGADHILVLTDIKKKHSSHSITNDISLIETGKAAQFFNSDGIILTGTATGHPPNLNDVAEFRQNINDMPLLVGSGVNDRNIKQFSKQVHAVIIGSHLKIDGIWRNEIDEEKVLHFVRTVNQFID